MKISVITATYNSANTLADCIQSVAKQTYPDIEHIVIDGQSKDNTVAIAESFPSVNKVVSEPDNGIFDAMNKGIRQSTGDVIAILNSDDFYAHENVLKEVVETFENNPNLGIVYGDIHYVDADDTTKTKRVWRSKQYRPGLFRTGWHPAHPAFFVKKEVYDRYGTFLDDSIMWIANDYEIMLRFMEKHRVPTQHIPNVMVKMRDGGNSNRSLKNIITGNKEVLKSWEINKLSVPYWIFITKPLSKLKQFISK